jgi:WD40 repeat protein
MTPERWKQIEEVFDRAIELSGDERAAFLDAACAGDADLRGELAVLLDSAAHASDSLHATIARGAQLLEQVATASLVGARVGAYRLREILGEGGMGTVYLASRDDAEYRRDVAIKILRPIGTSSALAARLRDERQLLAALDHPGIVRLLDGGSTDDGLPYLVMEHIDGVPLATYARALPVRARVELVVQIAAALQYAHQQLVVHRDVKPSNILVDATGTPRLLDFGIAKLTGAAADGREALTRTGMALFTVEYASPEQARGEPVTVATDVYSLGAVLYELLAGRPPQRRGASLVDTLANVCERDPQLPSAIAAAPDRRELAGDLDNIVMKALHKVPARRYPSAAAFADDLERYLAGLPVAARDATLTYRALKYARRHRGKLSIAALVASALAAATVVSIVQARRADRQAAAAERDNLSLLRERGIQELAIGRTSRALPYFADVLARGGDTPALRFLVEEARRPLLRELAAVPVPDGATGIAWSPDGARFAITAMNGHVGIYRADGTRLVRIETHGASQVRQPMFSPDGATLVAIDDETTVMAWDSASGEVRFAAAFELPAWIKSWGFTAAGDAVIASDQRGLVRVLDAVTGRERAAARVAALAFVALAPDGRHAAIGTGRGEIYSWDFVAGDAPRLLAGGGGNVFVMRYSRDGTKLYSAGGDHAVRIRDAATGRELAMLAGHAGTIEALDVARDDTRIATGSVDGTGILWDVASRRPIAVLSGLALDKVGTIEWSPDGAHVVTTSSDGTFRLWDARGNPEIAFEGLPGAGDARRSLAGSVIAAKFSPDGTRLLTASSREVRVRRVDRAPLVAEVDLVLPAKPFAAAWSPDDRELAIVGRGDVAGIRDAATLRPIAAIDLGGRDGWDVAYSPRGDRLAIVGGDGMALLRDARGAPIRALAGHAGIVNAVAWSPDGARVITSGDDGTARLWDPESGAQVATLAHGDRVMSAAWRRDGALLATACWDRKLRLWDPRAGTLVAVIDAGTMQLLSVAFDPTGRQIIAGSHGGDVAIFDVATRLRAVAFDGHTDAVSTAAWSPDGGLVATAGYDGTARVWDPATGAQLASRRGANLMSAAWSHDGTRLAGVGEDGRARIWDVQRATEPAAAIVGFVAERVPFRLVGTQLERVAR